jgi:hypothetical protein
VNYTSTILPATNDPLEIQKAILDLLQKINQTSIDLQSQIDSIVTQTNKNPITNQPIRGGMYYYGSATAASVQCRIASWTTPILSAFPLNMTGLIVNPTASLAAFQISYDIYNSAGASSSLIVSALPDVSGNNPCIVIQAKIASSAASETQSTNFVLAPVVWIGPTPYCYFSENISVGGTSGGSIIYNHVGEFY